MSNHNAAQVAAALANIIRGALSGGLHGAAIAAVKVFAPKLIKIAATIICALLLIPFLVFAALPNYLFGFESSASADISSMTSKATEIDGAYKNIDAFVAEIVEDIVLGETAIRHDSDGIPLFDTHEVRVSTGSTSLEWLVAISSVAGQQDLSRMSSDTVKSMVKRKLKWRTTYEPGTAVDEEGNETEITILVIHIYDINPDELMDSLGFNDEQRNWATVLYSSMTDYQYVDTGGGGGIYIGDITFTDAATPVKYYSQLDERWCDLPYGKSGTMGSSSCGPTSLAIAVATFKDSAITPVEVAEWSVDNGYRCEGNGSYHSLIPDGAKHYSLTVEAIGRDARKLVEALENGKLVIAIMSRGHFTVRPYGLIHIA